MCLRSPGRIAPRLRAAVAIPRNPDLTPAAAGAVMSCRRRSEADSSSGQSRDESGGKRAVRGRSADRVPGQVRTTRKSMPAASTADSSATDACGASRCVGYRPPGIAPSIRMGFCPPGYVLIFQNGRFSSISGASSATSATAAPTGVRSFSVSAALRPLTF